MSGNISLVSHFHALGTKTHIFLETLWAVTYFLDFPNQLTSCFFPDFILAEVVCFLVSVSFNQIFFSSFKPLPGYPPSLMSWRWLLLPLTLWLVIQFFTYSKCTFNVTRSTDLHCEEVVAEVRYLFVFFNLFIYLFLAVLCLRFCARAFSSCGKWGPLFITVRGPLTVAASLVVEHMLQTRRLSSCGSWAQLLCGMWDLPRPGLEPVSPALAGRFSTTAPPGKPGSLS